MSRSELQKETLASPDHKRLCEKAMGTLERMEGLQQNRKKSKLIAKCNMCEKNKNSKGLKRFVRLT